MQRTWASGACELLQHAQAHMKFESAFDQRVAFISVDNATELIFRTFVALPPRFFDGRGPTREDVENATGNFSRLVELAATHASARLDGLDLNDFEFFHGIRNTLYHHGTGISVDSRHVIKYFELACELLRRLLDVKFAEDEVPLLRRLKPSLRDEAMARAREMRRQEKAKKIRVINDRKKQQGIRIGRARKFIAPEHETLMKQWYVDLMPYERMAHELSRLRGAFDAISPETKRRRMVGAAIVKRRIGEWIEKGELPRQRRSHAGGLVT